MRAHYAEEALHHQGELRAGEIFKRPLEEGQDGHQQPRKESGAYDGDAQQGIDQAHRTVCCSESKPSTPCSTAWHVVPRSSRAEHNWPHGRLRTLDHAAREEEEEARSAKYSTSRRRPRAGAMNSLVNARVANSSTSPRWGCSGRNGAAK